MFPNPFVLFVPFCSKADFLPPSFCLKSDFSFPLSTFCFASCVFPLTSDRIFDYGSALTFEFRADQVNIVIDRPPIELISRSRSSI